VPECQTHKVSDAPTSQMPCGPVLDQVNLVVSDMERSVAFYRLLGVELPDSGSEWDAHHRSASQAGIDLDLDSEIFAGRWNSGIARSGATARVVIGFRIESREGVDAAFARLTAAGYAGQQAPYDAFWGSRYAVVEDPDGNAIGLMSPRDGSQRRPVEPPDS
jgi:predicted lactoylglutathione lyase